MAKASLSVETCLIYVRGLTATCPLCGVLVESGQTHCCSKPEPKPVKNLKAKS